MLTADEIIARRSSWPCCALEYLYKSIDAEIHGDNQCAKEAYEIALFLYWGARVMNGVPVLDGETGCYTIPFASQVAKKLDCYCALCPCEPSVPPFDSDCEVEVQHEVIDAIAQGSLPVDPDEGDAYYILSGANVGEIATWDGSQWVFTTVALNAVVQTEAGAYYTNTGNGPGLLFPPFTGVFVGSNNQYEIISSQPQIAQGSVRTVILYAYVNNTWLQFFSGPEGDFYTARLFDFATLQVTAVRAVYVVGDCSYPVSVTLVPPIDECVFPGDHDCADHEVTSHF